MVQLQELMNFYKWKGTHVDMNKILELEHDGLIQMKKHQEYPLFLLNYTAKAQFKQRWCKELILARGLVVREDGEIIDRPISKFLIIMKSKDLNMIIHKIMNCMIRWMEVYQSCFIMRIYVFSVLEEVLCLNKL